MTFRRTIPLFICFILTIAHSSVAQNIGMADTLRQEGKIYVVVAAVLLVLFTLLAYLWRLDRKLSKMESKNSKS